MTILFTDAAVKSLHLYKMEKNTVHSVYVLTGWTNPVIHHDEKL